MNGEISTMKMEISKFKRTKYSCYYTYLAMSSIFCLPPLLFVTFREMYGISYTLLGTLVLVNFCTQLLIDLAFTFFTKYFNIHKSIKLMPLLTSVGMFIYAFAPFVLPTQYVYVGLIIGTVIFSVSAGLCEVLMSPLVAALPSETPEKDMSLLHSLYAYGVVSVVVISTIVLRLIGTQNWMYLTMFWAVLPLFSFVLFCTSPMPEMNMTHNDAGEQPKKKLSGILLCVICIFLGSAAENTMTNWVSSYVENALQVPKIVGDVLGLACFAGLLGLGRSMYAKFGKNISKVLLWGMVGASACYFVVSFSSNVVVAMLACVLTGLCTSMLWPGTLLLMEENFPNPGVAAYALMAAGGDFGASVAPQLVGFIIDKVAATSWAVQLGETFAMKPEQIGMKVGMLIATAFPLMGIALLLYIKKYFAKQRK